MFVCQEEEKQFKLKNNSIPDAVESIVWMGKTVMGWDGVDCGIWCRHRS